MPMPMQARYDLAWISQVAAPFQKPEKHKSCCGNNVWSRQKTRRCITTHTHLPYLLLLLEMSLSLLSLLLSRSSSLLSPALRSSLSRTDARQLPADELGPPAGGLAPSAALADDCRRSGGGKSRMSCDVREAKFERWSDQNKT